MIVAADAFGIDFDVVDCDDHCRAVFSFLVSTTALFGRCPNSKHIAAFH